MDETDEGLQITTELTGVDKYNIHVSVTDNRITIREEKKSWKKRKKDAIKS